MADTVVIALGGSLIYSGENLNNDYIRDVAQIIAKSVSTGTQIGVVVGGGFRARKNITAARELGITNTFDLDLIGIEATRYNATALADALMEINVNVAQIIPETIEEAASLFESYSVVVMGGTVPGHTTDAVSINLAVAAGSSKCSIATNVDFVYDKAPQTNPDATPFSRMTLADLQTIVGPPEHKGAGPNVVIDPIGVQVAIDNTLPLSLLNGKETERIENCLLGKQYIGTTIEVE